MPVFYHLVKHRPENKVLGLSLQNEIDVLAYFSKPIQLNFVVLVDKASEYRMFSKNGQLMLENYFSLKKVDQLSQTLQIHLQSQPRGTGAPGHLK